MKKALLITFALLVAAPSLFATDWKDCIAKKPKEKVLVVDLTERGFMTKPERERLNTKLEAFAIETSNQLVVVAVDDLCGIEPWQYATELGQAWGVGGNAKFDNGVVILVKPYGKEGQRHVFIASGYGLQGVIPDAICKQIVENEILPQFRKSNFYAGVDKATNVLMALAKQEYDHAAYSGRNSKKPKSFPWPILLVIAFGIFAIIMVHRRRVKRYATLNDIGFWTAWNLLAQADARHRGQWSTFNHRGGSSYIGGGGSSGGGGFGGFGGGGFGGGGAGGSW